MSIQHNLISANQSRIFGTVIWMKGKVSEKLSSGYRINRAADDAAGLSISEKMRNQIRGLKRASANAMDGISLIQTAEGALQEMHHMLQRMEELAVQAANDTNSLQERQALQEEIHQIQKEVDKISHTTTFNGKKILDGTFATKEVTSNVNPFHSSKNTPNIYFFQEVTFHQNDITKKPMYKNAVEAQWYGLREVLQEEIVPQAVTEILELFPNTFGHLENANLGIGLTMAENDNSATVAAVSLRTTYSSDIPPVVELSYSLYVNISFISFDGTNNNYPTEASRQNLESTITHEMMHAFMMDALTAGIIGYDEYMVKNTAFPNWFVEGTAQAAGGGMASVKTKFQFDENTPEHEIAAELNGKDRLGTETSTSLYGTGYLATMYLGYLASGGTSMAISDIAKGLDLLMNEIRGGTSLNQAIVKHTNQKFTGITDFEARFAETGAGFVKEFIAQVGNGRGALVGGNYKETDILDDTPVDQPLFQLHGEHEEVWHEYPDGYPVISGGKAYDTGIPGYNHPANSGGITPTDPANPGGGTTPTDPANPGGGTTPTDPANPGGGTTPTNPTNPGNGGGINTTNVAGGLSLYIGNVPGQKLSIFIEGVDSRKLGIDTIDLTTGQGANLAITTIQNAVDLLSGYRSSLGAYQNRLEHTIRNLDNIVENTQEAESRIRDTDMAKEMVKFSKLKILEQAGMVLLAQSNTNQQSVLQLLSNERDFK